MKRMVNNTILLYSDFNFDEYEECDFGMRLYSSIGEYNPDEYPDYYGSQSNTLKLMDITDFSFCFDDVQFEYNRQYTSIYHTFHNYIYYNKQFSEITFDSLFNPETDYMPYLNELLIEEIKKRDDVELDCTNSMAYSENLKRSFSLSEKGMCIYLGLSEANDDGQIELEESGVVQIIIPYIKLKTIARKEGIIKYLLEKEGRRR